MEYLARAFDQPFDSPEHRELAEYGWIGGDFITVRYWLGRMMHRNFFRESDEVVSVALQRYFLDRGCKQGARVVSDRQSWSPLATILQHHAELAIGCTPTRKSRLVAALEAVMNNPELDDSRLAARANTTVKQIARMSDVNLLRTLWKRCGKRTAQ